MTLKPAAKANAGQDGNESQTSAAVQKALDLLEAGADESRWDQLDDAAVQAAVREYRVSVAHVSDELKSLGIESADLDSHEDAGNGRNGAGGPAQVWAAYLREA